MARKGKVYLTGAGPGAADLITVRAAQVLATAEVVIYDHLVNEELLNLAPPSAELIYAGKQAGGAHALDQSEINRLMIERARDAKRVVRLKGGDPFIFGRGGEEAMALAEAGIEFEVVPGITSAIAAPAYAGIPLTHRDYGSFVAFVTGHEEQTRSFESAVPWEELAKAAQPRGTLVLLMATGHLSAIAARLMAAGMSADTAAAAIQWGTIAGQKTISATLATIAADAQRAGLGAPAIVVIGQAAALRGRLRWYEGRPLFGRRIIVTRSRAQAGPLSQGLRELGAEVIELPAIETAPPDSVAALDRALAQLRSYNWVIFTAATGVDALMARMAELGHDVRELAGAQIAAIGPATAARLRNYGLLPAVVPDEYRAEAIAGAIGAQRIAGARIFIPRAQVAREALIELLRRSGAASVDVAAAYKTVCPQPPNLNSVRELVARRAIDLVTFTSSSTVSNFCELVGDGAVGLPAAAIGPITGQTAQARGLNVVATARSYTVAGLSAAIAEYFARAPA